MNPIRHYVELQLSEHAVLGTVPTGLRLEVWWRMAISHRHHYVYVRIPKAANSTVSKTLALYTWPERAQWFAARDAIWAKRRFGRFGWNTTPESLLGEHFTFSFFRNPYTRLLSAYLQKMPKRKYRSLARAARVTQVDETGFRAFVTWLEADGLNANIHWAPQTSICPLPVTSLDFIGHVENLDADLATLMGKLFPDQHYDQPATRQRDRQHAVNKLYTFYDEELAERVFTLYRRDFEELGYQESLPSQ
ncbi:MAG: sulfotransferase family 2 domain-containing protein [Gammaproteobacteria bacterium]|nr:sulfotransferase family 2 domain-containing protein [Gammaproteobacteria bacterium]